MKLAGTVCEDTMVSQDGEINSLLHSVFLCVII